MTLARDLRLEEEGTGPELRAAKARPSHLQLVGGRDVRGSESRPAPTEEFLRQARRALQGQDARSAERLATLGILVANLEGVPFPRIAACLGVSETMLIRLLHGEAPISQARHKQWVKVAEAIGNLHRVLLPAATNEWLDTPIPALGGHTPSELLRRGRYDEVLRVTRSYLDPSFA